MEAEGSLAININGQQTTTIHIENKQITINVKKITKIAKILRELHNQTKNTDKDEENQKTTDIPIKLIKKLNEKDYKIKIKIKGITIIRNLKPSNIELINKFL